MLKKSFYYFDNEAVKQIKLFYFLMVILLLIVIVLEYISLNIFLKRRSLLQIFVLTIKNGQDTNWKMQTFSYQN